MMKVQQSVSERKRSSGSMFDLLSSIDKPRTHLKGSIANIRKFRRGFLWFTLITTLNHSLSSVVTAFATPLLGPELGLIACGLNWFLYAVCALTVAAITVRWLGYQVSVTVALWGYSVQIVSLYAAWKYPEYSYPLAITGSCVSGATSAIFWTAQGVCVDLTSIKIADCMLQDLSRVEYLVSDEDIAELKAHLHQRWTLMCQLSTAAVFLSLSAVPIFLPFYAVDKVMSWLCVLSVVTALLGGTFDGLNDEGLIISGPEVVQALVTVPIHFLSDSRSVLIAPFLFGFSVSTALFAFYLNGQVSADPSLGINRIGMLEALSCIVAAPTATFLSHILYRFKIGQYLLLQLTSLSFLLCGAAVFLCPREQILSWRVLLVLRALLGLGRGLYDGPTRLWHYGMFAGSEFSTAMCSQTALAGLAGGICFFCFRVASGRAVAAAIVVSGVAALCLNWLVASNGFAPLPWRDLLQTSSYANVDSLPGRDEESSPF